MLAVSPQDVDSHDRWAQQEGFEFPLLADVEARVIGAYGVSAPVVGVRRSIFLIDTAGVVRARFSGGIRAIFKKPRELARVLEGMS